MSIAITFAGVTIEGVSEWGEDVGSRVQAENFPRRHGSIVQRLAFLKERIVTLSGEVSKADETDIENLFKHAFANTER